MREELIHESTRSRIFLVDDEKEDSLVVLKVLNDDFPHESTITQFYNQAEILDGLKINGVREVLGKTRIKNKHALKFEYFQGVPLKDIFDSPNVDMLLFLQTAVEICKVLDNIHHAGIIHRDVSPSNILVRTEDSAISFIDFEFSSRNISKDYGLSVPTHLLGTITYCSPEQTGRINRVVDRRSDLYSMGASFYELLTGRPPFIANDALEMVHAHIAQIPLAVNKRNKDIPEAVSNIITKLLEKNSEDRYQSVGGLQHDLERCLNEYQATGEITPFTIAQQDRSLEFAITEKLYGRETEIAEILKAFETTVLGGSGLVLISGLSGTGKTSLVHEVHKPITLARGFYIEGKFDQFQKSLPYSGILQAISGLIDLLLLENEATLATMSKKISTALGAEGKVLTNLIPNLELLIGVQPEIPNVAGEDSGRRFDYVVGKFFSALCDPEHPVVMFIDDIQWADAASLHLINNLLTSPSVKYFLCICAYRNNEVPDGHPLHSMIAGLEAEGVSIVKTEIGNLSSRDISHLIGDATEQDHNSASISSLTNLIIEKTQGNAFFATRFLKSIEEDNHIFYARGANEWRWDIDNIRAQNITDNVVTFLTNKIRTLSKNTQDALKTASAFGTQVNIKLFDIIYPGTEQQRINEFKKAMHEGLMSQLSESQFKFAHDRIVEAVYSLLEKDEKAALHLQIAQQLEANSEPLEIEARLFEIVNHFNQALKYSTPNSRQESDLVHLTELNYRAGIKAKTNSAFQLSLDYLLRAKNLLPEGAWQKQYQLTYNIHKEITDVSYLCGDYKLTDKYFRIVDQQAETTLDRVRAYEVKINAYKADNDLPSAIDIGLEALRLLGKKLPRHPTRLQVLTGLISTEIRLKNITAEKVLNLPIIEDEELFAAMRIMVNLTPSTYWAEPNLLPLLAFELIRTTLKHGLTELTGYIFAGYGIILCGVLEKMRRGQEFADLGLKLTEKFESKQWITQIVDPVYALVSHWNKHVDHGLQPLRDSFYIGLETGENEFACVNANIYCTNSLLSGKPLDALEKETEAFSTSFLKLKQETQYHYNEVFRQTMQCLIGQSEDPSILQGQAFDTENLLPIKEEREDKSGLFMIHFNRTLLSTFFGHYEDALLHADAAMNYVDAVLSKFEIPNLYFYRSLAALGVAANCNQKSKYLKIARHGYKKLKFYSKYAPQNFLHKVTIIESQIELVKNRFERSRVLTDLAIKQANTQGFVHEEALAYELGAYAYLKFELEDLGIYYLNQAYSLYQRWGAQAKMEQLLKTYPKYLSKVQVQQGAEHSVTVSGSGNASNLDMETIVKASLSLSSEVELPKLLNTMLNVVIENAGAQKGALILMHDDNLVLEAVLDISSNMSRVLYGQVLESQTHVPITYIQYIARTKKSLISNSHNNLQKFAQDEYIKRVQPESVLGLPILNQGRLIGVLYLENNVTKNAFTPDRVELLTILSSQIAVSLNNALLYQNLEQKVTERTDELAQEKKKSDQLLANILPKEVAKELKNQGSTQPKYFDSVSVMFADFVGFTKASTKMSAPKLVSTLDSYFKSFDEIIESHGLEKIKTIGDSYMCAGGLPTANSTHAIDTVAAAIDILAVIKNFNEQNHSLKSPKLEVRIGIHTGPLIAGVVGTKKFAYDIWGNTVNQASRMESSSEPGKINVSEQTQKIINDEYDCVFRGSKMLKNLGKTNMYFVTGKRS